MRRASARAFGAGVLLAGVLAWAAALPGLADPRIAEVGWWTRQPAAASAPQGGFSVADAPDGPVSVAALRIPLDGTVIVADLHLEESGGQGQDIASLKACLTTDQWDALAGGPYDQAPETECAEFESFTREGAKWSADVTNLLRRAGGTEASVMVVPGDASEGPAAALGPLTGFNIQFKPPVLEATSAGATTTRPPTTTPPTTGASGSDPPSGGAPSDGTPSSDGTASGGSPSVAPTATTRPSTGGPSAAAPTTTRAGPTPTARPAVTSTITSTAPASGASTPMAAGSGELPTRGTFAGRTNPDRIGGLGVIPYVIFAIVAGAAISGVRYLADTEFFSRLLPGRRA